MAIVRITPNIALTICAKVRDTYEADRLKINNTPPDTPPGLGEYFLGLVLPLEDQKKIYDLYPEGMKPPQHSVVGLAFMHAGKNTARHWSPVVHVQVKGCLVLPPVIKRDLPGVKELNSNGPMFAVTLDEDTSSMPKAIQEFVTKCADIHAKHDAINTKSKEAVTNMRAFLKDHRTLQSALKVMPALKFYLDHWLIQELDRKVEPRVRKPKEVKEKEAYDISGLITKAAVSRLSI